MVLNEAIPKGGQGGQDLVIGSRTCRCVSDSTGVTLVAGPCPTMDASVMCDNMCNYTSLVVAQVNTDTGYHQATTPTIMSWVTVMVTSDMTCVRGEWVVT